jgi:predicted amidohydrolase
MENLCYVAAVNRVGTDGNGHAYTGDSAVIDYLGNPLSECADMEVVTTSTLFLDDLRAHRERFPAMLDADRFELL